jgi:hypothetical protein
MQSRKVTRATLIPWLLVAMTAIPALAHEPEADEQTLDEVMAGKGIRDRFHIQLGGYFPELESRVALSPSGIGAGTAINLEELLDLENREKVFRLKGYWRFGLKHRFDFGWYEVDRSSSGTVDEEFQWGDETITVDSFVDSTFKTGVLSALYGYSMVHNSKIESGVSIGISGFDFSASLFAEDNSTGETVGDSASIFIPLVVVGYYSSVTLKPKWFFEYYLNAFTGSYDGYSGTLVDFGISSSYYPTKHFGFGFGFDGYRIDVGIDKDSFNGAIDYTNRGFNAFLIGVF